jgi:hypothetical protein
MKEITKLKRSLRLPRFLHCWYAFFMGYFWLPCPLCNRKFGGHEWTGGPNDHDSIMTSWSSGTGVCPNCHDAAGEYNKKWMEDNPMPASLGQPYDLHLQAEEFKVQDNDSNRHI